MLTCGQGDCFQMFHRMLYTINFQDFVHQGPGNKKLFKNVAVALD